MDRNFEFTLFGKTYRLQTTDGDVDELTHVVNYYKKSLQEVYAANPTRAQTDLFVLTGIKIADELFNVVKSKGMRTPDETKKIDKIVMESINLLDNSI